MKITLCASLCQKYIAPSAVVKGKKVADFPYLEIKIIFQVLPSSVGYGFGARSFSSCFFP